MITNFENIIALKIYLNSPFDQIILFEERKKIKFISSKPINH
jgi:hypothetical protein